MIIVRQNSLNLSSLLVHWHKTLGILLQFILVHTHSMFMRYVYLWAGWINFGYILFGVVVISGLARYFMVHCNIVPAYLPRSIYQCSLCLYIACSPLVYIPKDSFRQQGSIPSELVKTKWRYSTKTEEMF